MAETLPDQEQSDNGDGLAVVGTPLAHQSSASEPKSILDVPRRLYDELSQALGIGEEREAKNLMTGPWMWRLLNPEHPATGRTCAIAFHRLEALNANRLELWTREPRPSDREDPYAPPAAVTIIASPVDSGVWAYGSGTRMTEQVRGHFGHDNKIDLMSPFTRLVGLILVRAGELAKDPDCVVRAFWTGHHDID